MTKYKVCYTWIALTFSIVGFSQEILTLENAVKIAMENNYDIKIAKNDLTIDTENTSLGNAGMLPTLNGVANNNNTVQDTRQTQSDGSVRELDGAKNMNLNYGVALNWTIFDGFKMFARRGELKQLKNLGEAELQFTVLNKVSEVVATYHNLIQQKQQLQALDTTIVISKMRLNLATNRYTIGKASKLEVLNAQVDINTDQTNLLKQQELYKNTKAFLNEILARDIQTPFEIDTFVSIDRTLILNDLLESSLKQNPELQVQIINKQIAELKLKQVKGDRYPVINLTSGYNFNKTESSLGFITQSNAQGFNYGFNATLNIFNGGNQNRNERISKIQIENANLQIDRQKKLLETQIITSYETYLTNLALAQLEQKNEEIAQQNLDITLEKFKIGTITTVEFRTAQLNFVTAKTRNSTAQLQAKLSEISLKQLTGNINIQ